MNDTPRDAERETFAVVAERIQDVERVLEGYGAGLRFQVVPGAGLRLVRRLGPERNEPPSYEPLLELPTDPALWLVDQAEGRYRLCLPLGGPAAEVSGRLSGPAELYFDGVAIPFRSAVTRPSFLAALQQLAAFLWQVLPMPLEDR